MLHNKKVELCYITKRWQLCYYNKKVELCYLTIAKKEKRNVGQRKPFAIYIMIKADTITKFKKHWMLPFSNFNNCPYPVPKSIYCVVDDFLRKIIPKLF